MASPQRFVGNSMLQWNNMAAAGVSVPWHVELMFRTRQATATLLHISSSLQHNLTLQVSPALTNTHSASLSFLPTGGRVVHTFVRLRGQDKYLTGVVVRNL